MTKLRPARESRKPSHLAPIDRDSSTSGKSTVPSHPSASIVPSSTRASTPASLVSAQDVEFMRSRIRQLEGQLSKASDKSAQSRILTSNSDSEKTTSFMSGTFRHDSSLSVKLMSSATILYIKVGCLAEAIGVMQSH
jgi:hypothetical protein